MSMCAVLSYNNTTENWVPGIVIEIPKYIQIVANSKSLYFTVCSHYQPMYHQDIGNI